MKNAKISISKLCIFIGIGLFVIGAVVLGCWQWGIHAARKNVESYVQTIQSLIPEPQDALLEERRDNAMSVLSVEGTNFVGLLEMPKWGSVLPVGNDWGKVSKYPSRFTGSVYDSTLQIGATTQKGQYDFYREISVGDTVTFTDMEGNRFSYRVADICYAKHANQETLQKQAAALTLFIKNVYSFEYILIFCNPVG